jgi:hypothetical protein
MGLINLQTDLKSLKFGKDRPGGGSSKQPYIQKPISDNPQGNTGGTDFILRGGLKAPQRALEDVARLTKYIADGSKGILYTAKENLLSRMSVGTETSKGPAYAAGALNAGVYTPLSTLAQAGVGFAGTHLNKMGIDPTGLLPGLSLNKYETIVKDNNKIKNNKLEIVKGKLKGNVSNRLLKIYKDKQFTFSLNNNTILEYGGGPGSILGVGKTRIRFADQRTGQNNTDLSNSGFFSEGFRVFKDPRKGERTFNTTNLLKGITSEPIYNLPNQTVYINTGENVKDIFKFIPSSTISGSLYKESNDSKKLRKNPHSEEPIIVPTYIKDEPNYDLNRIENRINIGSIKKGKGKSLIEDSTKTNVYDKVNGSTIYKSDIGNGRNLSDDTNDLVAFRIGIIDSNIPTDDLTYMNFRSYIDSFSDSYSSDWKAQSYMGRGEKFYKYGGFDRSISMAFTVVAHSQGEMNGMYQKLNFLASSLAPTYTTEGYMAGNLVKMTVGNYIYEQYGFISSITYDIPQESSWDLSLTGHAGDGKISTMKNAQNSGINPDELPFMIKVTGLKFTPIHNFRPEINTYNNTGTAISENRFITEKLPFTPNHNNY